MNDIVNISFQEADILEKEALDFRIPHSKKLPDDHQYWTKRIVWILIASKDMEEYPYKEIEEDERRGVRYQEISEKIISEVNGITNEFIQDKLNSKHCFLFEFTPSELDCLIVRSDYKYKEINAIRHPYSRGVEYISFTYRNGRWEIDKEVEKVIAKKSRVGVLNIELAR